MSENWELELKDSFRKIKERLEGKLEEFSILRLNPTSFYTLKVEFEGKLSSLAELASLNLERARALIIKPYVTTQKLLHELEMAIKKAKPNVTINSKDGELICTIPEPTTELREAKIKESKQAVEEAKISLRNKRKEIQKQLKNFLPSENQLRAGRDKLEKEVSRYLSELESIWVKKEKEFRSSLK